MKPVISYIALLFFLTTLVNDLVAQTKISGTVADKTNSKLLSGVTIQLRTSKDSLIKEYTTNNSGVFSMENIKPGEYKILLNDISYKLETQHIEVIDKPVSLSFRLEPSEIEIEEVEITIPRAVLLKGDTMEYDATKFSTREYADADEVVAQVPGVMIDEEGNVTAHGEAVTKVIVDGKEFFSSDPRIALKNLPADIIAKIQIIDEKSEQAKFSGFDDGGRNKVINIVTKPDRKRGYFGKSNIGKSYEDKYVVALSINNFDGDKKYALSMMTNNINETNFAEQGRGGARRGNNNTERGLSDTYAIAGNFTNSYFDKKIEVHGDYNFRHLTTNTNILSNIELLGQNQANQSRIQDQLSDQQNIEHRLNGRIQWQIDSVNRIDFSPNFLLNKTGREFTTNSQTNRENTIPINSSNRFSNDANNNINYGGSLTYMYRFKKPGRTASLNIAGNKSTNDDDGLNLAITSYYRNANLSRIDTNNNKSLTDGYGSGVNTRLSLTENLSKRSRLHTNYNFRNTANYSNRETFEFLAETGQLGKLRDRLSNEFRNDYIYHSAGASYSYNKKDTLRIQVGVNYQHGIRINDRTIPLNLKTKADFSSILPELTAVYHFSKEQNIEFNYNTQTNTPSINQLQDFINNQNELRITNGNPLLNQEYSHTLRLQYKDVNTLSGRSLTTNLHVEFINDKIINSILMTDTTIRLFDDVLLGAGGQYTLPKNVDGAYAARMNTNYGLPIKSLKINFNTNTRLFYTSDIVEINDKVINSTSYGFGQTVSVNSNFSKAYIIGFSYNIDGRYTENPLSSVGRYEVYTHRVNNNLSLEFFKKFVLTSNFMYLFNTGLMGSPAVKTTIWNASLGFKILKRKNAEIAIKGFDLLNNAQNVSRRVNENSISNITSNTLNRYFLMSLTYNLRKFGS